MKNSILFLITISIFLSGCDLDYHKGEEFCEMVSGKWYYDEDECELLDNEHKEIFEELCVENKGDFQDCLSACRYDRFAEACTDLCISVCRFDENIG